MRSTPALHSNLLIVSLLGACVGCQKPPAADDLQSFSIAVDGELTTMDPGAPEEGHTVTSNFTDDGFNLGAFNRTADFQFGVNAAVSAMAPGIYQVFSCVHPSGCDDDQNQAATLSHYPTGELDLSGSVAAYRVAELGLAPLELEIVTSQDASPEGNLLPSKRVTGFLPRRPRARRPRRK